MGMPRLLLASSSSSMGTRTSDRATSLNGEPRRRTAMAPWPLVLVPDRGCRQTRSAPARSAAPSRRVTFSRIRLGGPAAFRDRGKAARLCTQ